MSEPGLAAQDDYNAQQSEQYEQDSNPGWEPDNKDDENEHRH